MSLFYKILLQKLKTGINKRMFNIYGCLIRNLQNLHKSSTVTNVYNVNLTERSGFIDDCEFL